MAYRRSTPRRSRYGAAPRSSRYGARRRTARVSRARRPRSGRGGTVRIEIVQAAAPVARPVIGMKPADTPKKRIF